MKDVDDRSLRMAYRMGQRDALARLLDSYVEMESYGDNPPLEELVEDLRGRVGLLASAPAD